jgi:hypothetical protein
MSADETALAAGVAVVLGGVGLYGLHLWRLRRTASRTQDNA